MRERHANPDTLPQNIRDPSERPRPARPLAPAVSAQLFHEPGFGVNPMPLSGSDVNIEGGGCLFERQSREIPQLHQLRDRRVLLRQLLECLIDIEYLHGQSTVAGRLDFPKLALPAAAIFEAAL